MKEMKENKDKVKEEMKENQDKVEEKLDGVKEEMKAMREEIRAMKEVIINTFGDTAKQVKDPKPETDWAPAPAKIGIMNTKEKRLE